MTHTSRNYGFTLIELLVVIAILLVIMGGAIAGFMTFRDRRAGEETAKRVQALFFTAQQKASVQESPPQCISPLPPAAAVAPLQGYRVNYDAGSRTFSLLALCGFPPTGNTTGIPTEANLVAYPVTDNATITNSIKSIVVPSTVGVTVGATNFDFYTLQRSPAGANVTRTYTFTVGSDDYSFTVTSSGTITNVQ
jgi:prepilin-type N-terminal cleavage/methylation domain-containing protein